MSSLSRINPRFGALSPAMDEHVKRTLLVQSAPVHHIHNLDTPNLAPEKRETLVALIIWHLNKISQGILQARKTTHVPALVVRINAARDVVRALEGVQYQVTDESPLGQALQRLLDSVQNGKKAKKKPLKTGLSP